MLAERVALMFNELRDHVVSMDATWTPHGLAGHQGDLVAARPKSQLAEATMETEREETDSEEASESEVSRPTQKVPLSPPAPLAAAAVGCSSYRAL